MTVPRHLSNTGVAASPSIHWPPISRRARRVPVSWTSEANAVLPFLNPREIETGHLAQVVERLELSRFLPVGDDCGCFGRRELDHLNDVLGGADVDVDATEV